jgi:hypothetical protein
MLPANPDALSPLLILTDPEDELASVADPLLILTDPDPLDPKLSLDDIDTPVVPIIDKDPLATAPSTDETPVDITTDPASTPDPLSNSTDPPSLLSLEPATIAMLPAFPIDVTPVLNKIEPLSAELSLDTSDD